MGCVSEILGPLPPGYAVAPILAGQASAPLRLCAVVRHEPDPVGGHWVVLRDTFDARVYLGAVADAAGTVHEYAEIWVQTLDTVRAETADAASVTNRSLDDRWASQFQGWAAADPGAVFQTGWEARHPAPLLIDPKSLSIVKLAGAGEGGWRLCEDDALLRQVGLPAFSTSLDRYLFQPALGKEGPFVPVTPNSPAGPSSIALEHLLVETGAAEFNVGGGLIGVRPFHPLAFEELLEVLRTGEWTGTRSGRSILPWAGQGAQNGDDSTEHAVARPLLARDSRSARTLEAFYLTLCAISSAADSVRQTVLQTQRPILNLTAESLRVSFCRPGPGLPMLWTARVALADPGDAIPLSVAGSDSQYFVRVAKSQSSIYRPSASDVASAGRGSFRIRQVLPEGRGVVVEGTFTPRERLQAARNDLLRLRVGVAAGRVDLCARLQPDMALAGGEWRLRSLPQAVGEPIATQLRAAEGVPLANIEYEHIPLQSTPCDLYSLAVLAVRSLLVKPGASPAVMLDEMLSLARQSGLEADAATTPLPLRIASIFSRDMRWAQSLSPQALFGDGAAADPRRWLIPAELWWETLAAIVRMFPGLSPDSIAVDLGDAPPGAIHRVFDSSLADWDALITKTRGLILGDWQLNREVRGVIGRFLDAM